MAGGDEAPVGRPRLLVVGAELREEPIGREPGRGLGKAGGGGVGAPGPIAGVAHHPGTDGVEHDVAAELEEVGVALDEDRLEAALEDMARAAMAAVEGLAVDAVEVAHAARERRARGLDQQVVVVGHQAEGVAEPAPPLDRLRQDAQEGLPVVVVAVDGGTGVAAAGDVVDGARELEAERAGHRRISGERCVNDISTYARFQDLTPKPRRTLAI